MLILLKLIINHLFIVNSVFKKWTIKFTRKFIHLSGKFLLNSHFIILGIYSAKLQMYVNINLILYSILIIIVAFKIYKFAF